MVNRIWDSSVSKWLGYMLDD